MFQFNVAPYFQLINPPFQISGQTPNKTAGTPGRVGFQVQVPNGPIINIQFDRNEYEGFVTKLKIAADVMKGVKTIGDAANEIKEST